ncbi:hypothetical protein V9K67_10275 [Paraflavisolibacter sp. H34]|uniref:hypothetical protein n=1 Tax=Huijunlia imazamoxiresistens TaxID=3127457 RepID=UPI003019BE38
MDVEAYKKVIGAKDVLDHTTLNITVKELAAAKNAPLAGELQRILRENRIPKPESAAKPYDPSPTYYKVDLATDQIEVILDLLWSLEDSFVSEEGQPTPTSAFYANLADKWDQLVNP